MLSHDENDDLTNRCLDKTYGLTCICWRSELRAVFKCISSLDLALKHHNEILPCVSGNLNVVVCIGNHMISSAIWNK